MYHLIRIEDSREWTQKLRLNIGYRNFFDSYEMIHDIGNGKFGLVKLGMNLITKEKVAIKIIKKKDLKEEDIQLIQNEIEILKINKHPNLITFIDFFENSEFLFLIMESAKHGNLISLIL